MPWHDAVMEIARSEGEVTLRMSADEAQLLSFALRAGFETTSRPEYWIRHGVAQPSARAVAEGIYEVAIAKRDSANVDLKHGVENVENPRRPRPS
jgi:hypothetical protein